MTDPIDKFALPRPPESGFAELTLGGYAAEFSYEESHGPSCAARGDTHFLHDDGAHGKDEKKYDDDHDKDAKATRQLDKCAASWYAALLSSASMRRLERSTVSVVAL